jgi:hypothetical protein
MENYQRMFEDLAGDDGMQKIFVQNPVSVLVKYNLITSDDIGQADRRLVIGAGNKILFLLLSNPVMRKWLKEYQSELKRQLKDNFNPSELDRRKIYKDIVEGTLSAIDPHLLKAISDYYRIPDLTIQAFAEAEIDVSGADTTWAVSDVLAITEAVAIAIVVVVVVVIGEPIGGLEEINRREFSALFDSVTKGMYVEAEAVKAKYDAIAKAKGMPFS